MTEDKSWAQQQFENLKHRELPYLKGFLMGMEEAHEDTDEAVLVASVYEGEPQDAVDIINGPVAEMHTGTRKLMEMLRDFIHERDPEYFD